jgi:hypothetical protein
MTTYQVFLYLHVAGATIWVGGAATLQLLAIRARTRGLDGLLTFAADAAWLGKRLIGPSTIVVVGCGVGMVLEGPWSFSDDWITIALILVATAYALVLGPMEQLSTQVRTALEQGDGATATAKARLQTVVSRVELAVLFLVVFDMALKPTFADHGVIAWGVGGFAVATVAVVARGGRGLRGALRPALDGA